MKKKESKTRLEDIIFEDRNKEYGAFEILKSFRRRLKVSFTLALLLFFLFIMVTGGLLFLPFGNEDDYSDRINHVIVHNDPTIISLLRNPEEPRKPHKVIFVPPVIKDDNVVPDPNVLPDSTRQEKPEEKKPDSLLAEKHMPVVPPEIVPSRKPDTLLTVDSPPQFPGGPEALKLYINAKLRYPADAIRRDKQGVVMVSFLVDKEGTINYVMISKSVDPILDFEAVRVIQAMPPWRPARRQGKPIAMMLVLPVSFGIR